MTYPYVCKMVVVDLMTITLGLLLYLRCCAVFEP
jgi:hypothetical protein